MVNIEEFLTNPLLVSLLFTAFEHKQAIPFKKYLFYRQVYDANFESHDLTKGDSYTHDKYSKLEIDDFHRVLRHIGFNCFKLQRIEFSKDELLKLISESRSFCAGLTFKESDFLQDIIKTVPLFAQDGNYYRWSHKSLQEYFCAQFIYLDSKDKQNHILLRLYNHSYIDKFINVLDLYYDMDYKTFRNTIELELVSEFKNFAEKSYKHFDEKYDPLIVTQRKELMFFMNSFLFKASDQNNKRGFDDEKFSEMLKIIEEKYHLDANNFSGIVISPQLIRNIYGLHFQNSKISILMLLLNKKSSLINELAGRRNQYDTTDINLNFKKEYEYKIVTDDENDHFNSPSNFNDLNKFLAATRLYPVTINTSQAILKLKEINDSIEVENRTDFLLGGI